MIDGERAVGIVPARGGSKGVPRKNLRQVAGRSLLAWTAQAARASAYLDRVILSSEDAEILDEGRACGLEVPFVRPAALAQDDTPGIDPVLHALDELETRGDAFGWVVLLQPTSPLRMAGDIDAAIERCLTLGAPAAVTVAPVSHSPWWMFTLDDDHLRPLLDPQRRPARRQDSPEVVALNGAVYVARTSWLRQTRSFLTDETVASLMPRARSLDIDEPADLVLAEAALSSGGGEGP